MKQRRIRVVVAIAHLEGDDDTKIEGQLRDALAGIDRRAHRTQSFSIVQSRWRGVPRVSRISRRSER